MSACLVCGCAGFTPLFQSSDRLYQTTEKEFEVVRCQECGLVRMEPQPSPAELHQYYPGSYWFAPEENAASRLEELYRRIVLRDHVGFVERALRESGARGPLLDVGCGGGLFLGMMRQRGFRVVGLDYSRDAAAVAWRRQLVPAVVADLAAAPLAPGRFAGITMFHVLEHLADPRAYLASARQLLAADGRLVVQVPNAASWQARVLGSAWSGYDVPRHLFDFEDRHLERLLEECGFQVVRRKYFSLRDNPAGMATSMVTDLDPMARRIRRAPEGGVTRLCKDLVYFALVVASVAPTLLEAACQAGSTVMLEARLR